MRIGISAVPKPGTGLAEIVAQAVAAEAGGFASFWLANIFGNDALVTLAMAGQQTRTIELGTFVVPTYPRHPMAMAQEALTVQAAVGGRLTLGVGLSHRVTMEGMLGFDWDHPIRHTREYLTVLNRLLAQKLVNFDGEEYRLRGVQLTVPGAMPPPLLVAALGPQMLKLAGQLADGTAIWMGGARYIAETAVPIITKAAAEAGRPAPRIMASLPVCVTGQPDAVRDQAGKDFARYGQLPSYRAILDREGVAGPSDVALIGSAAEVRAGLQSLADAGVTDFAAAIIGYAQGEVEATTEVLREVVAAGQV